MPGYWKTELHEKIVLRILRSYHLIPLGMDEHGIPSQISVSSCFNLDILKLFKAVKSQRRSIVSTIQ